MSASTPRPRPNKGPQRTGSTGGTSRRAAKGARNGSRSKKPKLTRKDLFRKYLKYVLIAGVVGTLLMVSIFYFAYRQTEIPNPNTAFQAQTTNVYFADGKSKIGRFATQNRESVKLSEISEAMQDAVVAAEDRTFWTNKGIDPKGILRAAFSNAKGNSTQGASTITQQYVKILYLSQERTIQRKIKEAFLSLKIQQQQSKSQILEGYLNTIYFGRGSYGVQAAANAYFGTTAKKLNASQAAMLAAILNSPNYLSPDRSEEARAALTNRYDYVLSGMADSGAISESEAAAVTGKLPKLRKPSTSNTLAGQTGFMLDMVKDELLKAGFDDAEIQGGGLKVTTTFTEKAMDAAKEGVLEQKPTGLAKLHAAAASVDTKTGALLGFYAGQDYLKSQLNWANLGNAPGSSFKPFALAAGLKAGFALKDTFQGSSPYRLPNGDTVKNEGQGDGHSYGSRIDLVKATQESVNTAYVDLTESMPNGPKKIHDMAIAMGIPATTDIAEVPSIALGFASVSPIDMANAYGTIADGGLAKKVFVVSKVTRASDGEVLYTANKTSTRAMSEDIASDVSYALQQVVKGGTGAAAQSLGRPAAGKTGTATRSDGQVISSWFVGYTPQVSTAVMYIRDNGRKSLEGYLEPFYGASFPARTWTAVMKRDMEGVDVEDFPPPARVDGKAPDAGHAPTPTAKPKPPKPTEPVKNGVCSTTAGDPDCVPAEPVKNGVCSTTPGDPDCVPAEPVKNGVCSTTPGDPDCAPAEPVQNGVCSDVPDDPDCAPPPDCGIVPSPGCTPSGRTEPADRQRIVARQETFA